MTKSSTIFMRTRYDNTIDWDDVNKSFSSVSGARVWCEKDGEYMNFFTDGDPAEVMLAIVESALGELSEMLSTMGELFKWERNARLN